MKGVKRGDRFLQADFPVLICTMRIWITSGSPTIRELPEKHQTLVVIHFELGLVNVHRSELNLLPEGGKYGLRLRQSRYPPSQLAVSQHPLI